MLLEIRQTYPLERLRIQVRSILGQVRYQPRREYSLCIGHGEGWAETLSELDDGDAHRYVFESQDGLHGYLRTLEHDTSAEAKECLVADQSYQFSVDCEKSSRNRGNYTRQDHKGGIIADHGRSNASE